MKRTASLIVVIDKAAEIAGSYKALAQMLGTRPQAVSDWRKGRKPCPMADLALMASMAGLDPAKEIIRALLEENAGTAKGDMLARSLGKGLVATGAAIATAGAHASAIYGTAIDWFEAVARLLPAMYRKVKFRPTPAVAAVAL